MATDTTVGIVTARDEATHPIVDVGATAVTDDTLEAIRALIPSELRRCGLRPPTPPGPGAWRWDAERDEWISLVDQEPSAPIP